MNERDQLRKAQLYITEEIKRICEANEINYFLDSGSLLGAVRHHGFIPWDDDMDIGMKKDDYSKFIQIAAHDLRSDFFLDNYNTNSDNALVFSKVRLKNTIYLETKGNSGAEHNEIFVDVFPYYYISDNEMVRRIEGIIMSALSQAIMSRSGYRVWKGESLGKRLKFIPTDLLGVCMDKKTMHHIIDYLFNKHVNTSRLCIHAGSDYGYWFFPKEVFDEFVDIEFEGHTFKIPKLYDTYLSTAYGDYMVLPPEKNRITHLIQKLDLGEYHFE